ncbi:MAG: hypothetical protein QG589_528 [Patescibacteria group bacterium]|nr:hypothetical protein [Patescibacteria group bacterium]
MINYEVWYVELRYRDESRTWMTSSDPKSIPFEEADDQKAVTFAKKLLSSPSDDPLVTRRVFNKLVRIVEVS